MVDGALQDLMDQRSDRADNWGASADSAASTSRLVKSLSMTRPNLRRRCAAMFV